MHFAEPNASLEWLLFSPRSVYMYTINDDDVIWCGRVAVVVFAMFTPK